MALSWVSRTFAGLVAAVVVLSATPAPARPEGPPRVPSAPSIEDPVGDANYLTTGWANYLGVNHGGITTPADASEAADIRRVWFETRGKHVYVYIQVEALTPDDTSIHYAVLANKQTDPDTGLPVYCTQFQAALTGGEIDTNANGPDAYYLTGCNTYGAEVKTWELPDGSGVVEISVLRTMVTVDELTAPVAFTAHTTEALRPEASDYSQQFAWIDSTAAGSDYRP